MNEQQHLNVISHTNMGEPSAKKLCDEVDFLPGKDWRYFFQNFEETGAELPSQDNQIEETGAELELPSQDINQTLQDLKNSLTNICSTLDGKRKRKRVTLTDIDKKLDSIVEAINALRNVEK